MVGDNVGRAKKGRAVERAEQVENVNEIVCVRIFFAVKFASFMKKRNSWTFEMERTSESLVRAENESRTSRVKAN